MISPCVYRNFLWQLSTHTAYALVSNNAFFSVGRASDPCEYACSSIQADMPNRSRPCRISLKPFIADAALLQIFGAQSQPLEHSYDTCPLLQPPGFANRSDAMKRQIELQPWFADHVLACQTYYPAAHVDWSCKDPGSHQPHISHFHVSHITRAFIGSLRSHTDTLPFYPIR